MELVRTWKTKVVNGRLVLIDARTDLPDGTELELIPALDSEATLTPEEDEGLRKALTSLRRGEGVSYDEVRSTLDRILRS